MANNAPSFPLLSILLLSFYHENFPVLAVVQTTWCVAKPAATNRVLQGDKDYSCSHADCSPIQQDGSCFYPNTLIHHASYAMNAYYHSSGSRHKFDCNFKGSGLIALTHPGSSSCSYPGSDADVDTSRTWCVAKPTASDDILKSNIEFACRQTNCGPIEEGGLCFKPNTLWHHASYAMNNYYQLSGKVAGSCVFQNSAMVVTSNPGYGSGCYYASAPPQI